MLSRSDRLKRKRERRKRMLRRTLLNTAALVLLVGLAAAIYWQFGGSKVPPLNPPFGNGGAQHDAREPNHSEEPSQGADESGGGSQQEGPAEQASPGAGTGGDTPASKPDPSPEGEAAEVVTLSFVGDVMMADNVERLVEERGYDYPFQHVRAILLNSDVSVANLETSVTEGGERQEKQYAYRTKPKALDHMRNNGIGLVTLANNHSLDYGVDGFLDTLDHLDQSGIVYVGGGRNEEEAYRPAIVERKGVKIAFLGFSMVVPYASWKAEGDRPGVAQTYDYRQPTAAIERASEEADLVVVLVHWGEERKEWPNEQQQEMAHRYIDAGADLVVGSHPHVLQGIEHYKGKWIFYSLGNFIFTTNENRLTWESAILNASCKKTGECDLDVVPIRNAWALPTPLTGEEAARLLGRLSDLSIHATVNENGSVQAIPDE